MTSHLTTLIHRFLQTLEDIKVWNHLQHVNGERELRRQLCSIIEYTFYFHKQKITEREVEKLIHLLEKGGT